MNPDQLKQYLEFYKDLGVKDFYRASAQQAQAVATAPAPVAEPNIPIELPALVPANDTLESIRADIGDCRRCRLCEQRNPRGICHDPMSKNKRPPSDILSYALTIAERPHAYPSHQQIPPKKARHIPITGFRESVFTSATGLYTQLTPTAFSSAAEAAPTRSARSGEPVAASAIAPGLRRCVSVALHPEIIVTMIGRTVSHQPLAN